MALFIALILLSFAGAGAHADVQDYRYDSWAVEYEVGVDEAGRAVAHVTETITAVFPDHDQNRGIVRGIPERYQGANLDPRDFSVTDEAGRAVPFELESDDGFTAVLTGGDDFVHGVTTYVISYTLSDVVLARDDGAADEFYWDLMDFEHAQPVASFTAHISFDEQLAQELTGDARCYAGAAGTGTECMIELGTEPEPETAVEATVGRTSWSVEAGQLAPYEGVTVAIGLAPGAVVQPATRLPDPVLDTLPLVLAGTALVIGGTSFAFAAQLRRKRRTMRGTIVAQYEVPEALPPLVAASIVGASPHPVPAEFVHLAVRGALRIEAGEARPGIFGKEPRPTLRIVDPSRAVDPLDQRTLARAFASVTPGAAREVPRSDAKFARAMEKLKGTGISAARSRGYFEQAYSPAGRVIGIVGIVFSAAAIALGFTALVTRETPWPLIAIAVGGGALAGSVLGTVPRWVHTRAGAEAREHLLGVREFIRVAEADRLEVLQSYAGAERRDVDGVAVVHLYERLLPYAMLFGLQKRWGRVLEVRYEETTGYVPLWVVGSALGHSAAGIVGIESTISSFTSSFTSAVSYTSSSSGGSSGGGFAGGGGGGGFSGGR
ncbi:DUF2207 domain-containing protein [Leucobacter sp. HY1910]